MRGLVVVSALAFAACSDAGGPAPVIVPQLAIVAGDLQTDAVMRTLPVQLGAKLTNKATGEPLPGRIVNWVVVEGGGAVFAAVTQTASDGVARQSWTLGPHVGNQKLIARWLNPETGEPVTLDTARAVATPDTAATFYVVGSHDMLFHPPLDTIAVSYGYSDRWSNSTRSCGGTRDPDGLTWVAYGGDPYGADSLVRPLRVDPVAHALLIEVGGYAPSVGTTAWLRISSSCVQGGTDSVLMRFDWQ